MSPHLRDCFLREAFTSSSSASVSAARKRITCNVDFEFAQHGTLHALRHLHARA